jgi:hypothetical protein
MKTKTRSVVGAINEAFGRLDDGKGRSRVAPGIWLGVLFALVSETDLDVSPDWAAGLEISGSGGREILDAEWPPCGDNSCRCNDDPTVV